MLSRRIPNRANPLNTSNEMILDAQKSVQLRWSRSLCLYIIVSAEQTLNYRIASFQTKRRVASALIEILPHVIGVAIWIVSICVREPDTELSKLTIVGKAESR